MPSLESIALFALLDTFLVTLVRALPWPKAWTGRKPLGCDACMVGWVVLLHWASRPVLTWLLPTPTVFQLLAAGGGALLALGWLRSQQAFLPP